METLFRIATDRYELSIEGTEEFVREGMKRFLGPPAGGGAGPVAAVAPAADTLPGWYAGRVPSGRTLTMQDAILAFGYYLKRVKDQHLFTPSDVKRCFREVDRRIPKSLLQIMGTLKRDHGLLWSPEDRRGQYALTPTGIRHVERLLGVRKEGSEKPAPEPAAPPSPAAAGAAPAEDEEPSGSSEERFRSLFREEGGADR